MAPPDKKTQFARLRERIENSDIMALVLVLGIAIIGASSFLEAVVSLRQNSKALLPIERRIADFDRETHEQTLRIAKMADVLLLQLAEEGNQPNSFHRFLPQYRAVEVELRNLVLRNVSRPLNGLSTEQTNILLRTWLSFAQHHGSKGHVSPAFVQEVVSLFRASFRAVLTLENAKLRGAA